MGWPSEQGTLGRTGLEADLVHLGHTNSPPSQSCCQEWCGRAEVGRPRCCPSVGSHCQGPKHQECLAQRGNRLLLNPGIRSGKGNVSLESQGSDKPSAGRGPGALPLSPGPCPGQTLEGSQPNPTCTYFLQSDSGHWALLRVSRDLYTHQLTCQFPFLPPKAPRGLSHPRHFCIPIPS